MAAHPGRRDRGTRDGMTVCKRGVARDDHVVESPRPVRARVRKEGLKENASSGCNPHGNTSMDESAHGRRFDSGRAAPVPTRARSMATQANDESILRDTTAAYNTAPAREIATQANDKSILRETAEDFYQNSKPVVSNRIAVKELKYPDKERTTISEASKATLERAAASAHGNSSVAALKVLMCAVSDEITTLHHAWGLDEHCPDVAKTPEERVAACLKRLATKAQKESELKVFGDKCLHGMEEDVSDPALPQRCEKLEAEIAAKRKEIARYTRALKTVQQGAPVQPLSTAVTELSTRLRSSLQDTTMLRSERPGTAMDVTGASRIDTQASYMSTQTPPPHVLPRIDTEIANHMRESMLNMAATDAGCRQMLLDCQNEQDALQTRNQGFCPPSQACLGSDSGARCILSAIR